MEKVKELISKFGEWNKKNWNAGGKDRWKFIGLWLLVLFVIGSVGEKQEQQKASQTISSETSAPAEAKENSSSSSQPIKVQDVSDVSFYQIRRNMESMTEAQFKEYARSLKGKRIRWRGYVEEVNEKMFGGYELWVDMDSPNNPASVQDVTFDVSKSVGLSLRKDQSVTFEGTIDSAMSILTSLQIDLEDAQVLN